MGYIEYLNEEIPTWMTELRTEDEQKIHDAFMECYNREGSIKLYERYIKENPQKKESYEKSIAEIEISLAQKKQVLFLKNILALRTICTSSRKRSISNPKVAI